MEENITLNDHDGMFFSEIPSPHCHKPYQSPKTIHIRYLAPVDSGIRYIGTLYYISSYRDFSTCRDFFKRTERTNNWQPTPGVFGATKNVKNGD